jgi:hypothetical protein
MGDAERFEAYRAIEEYRAHPLIVYATTTRQGVPGAMAGDAIRQFIDQIDSIPAEQNTVDVLIHSTGGDALTAWRLMATLRERFDQISVLVPSMAFSAATLFALGANKILMHPHASLGPIDPQVTAKTPDGGVRQFAYEDVGAFLTFLTDDVGLSDQPHVTSITDRLFQTVDPLVIGAAKRASDLSKSVGERLLRTHLTEPEDRDRPAQIAEGLNKSFFAHGDAVSRSRARELDMQIGENDPKLEALMWGAFLEIEELMRFREPFNQLFLFLSDPKAAATLDPPAPLNLPPNTPSNIVTQVWNAAAKSAVQQAAKGGAKVEYELVNAIVESPRLSSQFRSEGYVSAIRQVDGTIRTQLMDTNQGWRELAISSAGP